jgi:hypothetical protein
MSMHRTLVCDGPKRAPIFGLIFDITTKVSPMVIARFFVILREPSDTPKQASTARARMRRCSSLHALV